MMKGATCNWIKKKEYLMSQQSPGINLNSRWGDEIYVIEKGAHQ